MNKERLLATIVTAMVLERINSKKIKDTAKECEGEIINSKENQKNKNRQRKIASNLKMKNVKEKI